MSTFTRGFRLHPRSGPPLDGAQFPTGRVIVLDDPSGYATGAASMDDLLRGGYHSARIEWSDQEAASPAPTADLTETPEDAAHRFARRLSAVERLCAGRPGYHTVTVKQLLTAMGGDADD